MSYPAFGTAPIKCSKRKCDWKGYETGLVQVPGQRSTCPKCGCDSYYFMTEREAFQAEIRIQAAKKGEQANG